MTDQEPPVAARSITHHTVRGFAQLASSTLATAILRIVVVGVMARLLAPNDFGVVAIANIFVEFGRMIATTGVSQSIVQMKDPTPDHLKTAFTSSLAIGVLAMVAVIAASSTIAAFFGLPNLENVLYVSSVIPPIMAASTISSKLLERAHNFKPIAKSNVTAYVSAQVAVGIPIAYAGGGYWALIVPQVVGALLQSIILMRAQPHDLSLHFGRSEYRDLMKLGTGFGLQRFANFLAQRGDYFVVGKVLGLTELGRYERSYVLMNLSNTLLASMLSTVLFPAFARIAHDRDRFRRAYVRCMQLSSAITLPISVVCIILAQEIVETLLGSRWLDAATPFAILAGGIFIRTCYKVAGSAGNGLGLAYQNALSQTLYALCVIAGAAIGSFWGINGVAISTLISIAIVFFLLNNTVIRQIGLSWVDFAKALLPSVASATLVGAISLFALAFFREQTELPAAIRLVASLSIAGIVYLPCAAIMPSLFLGRNVIELLDERLPRTGPVARGLRLICR